MEIVLVNKCRLNARVWKELLKKGNHKIQLLFHCWDFYIKSTRTMNLGNPNIVRNDNK